MGVEKEGGQAEREEVYRGERQNTGRMQREEEEEEAQWEQERSLKMERWVVRIVATATWL
jgi:hypothetical protein